MKDKIPLSVLFEKMDEREDQEDDGLTCRQCGASGLMWDRDHHDVTGKWRLISLDYPPAIVHVCPKTPATEEFEPI